MFSPWYLKCLQELEAIKARVREMEEEAEKLKELQNEVEKQMNLSPPPGECVCVCLREWEKTSRWTLLTNRTVLKQEHGNNWVTLNFSCSACNLDSFQEQNKYTAFILTCADIKASHHMINF